MTVSREFYSNITSLWFGLDGYFSERIIQVPSHLLGHVFGEARDGHRQLGETLLGGLMMLCGGIVENGDHQFGFHLEECDQIVLRMLRFDPPLFQMLGREVFQVEGDNQLT